MSAQWNRLGDSRLSESRLSGMTPTQIANSAHIGQGKKKKTLPSLTNRPADECSQGAARVSERDG